MDLRRRLGRAERELQRRPPLDQLQMTDEDRRIAQRIIARHFERFGPPPGEDDASIVRWLASRGGARIGPRANH